MIGDEGYKVVGVWRRSVFEKWNVKKLWILLLYFEFENSKTMCVIY